MSKPVSNEQDTSIQGEDAEIKVLSKGSLELAKGGRISIFQAAEAGWTGFDLLAVALCGAFI